MPSPIHVLEIKTDAAEQFVDLTSKVKGLVQKSGVQSGLAVVYCQHTTAGLTIQENTDPALKEDILAALERAVPKGAAYKHNEENAHAHVRAALLGSSATVLIDGGKLLLGAWQAIYLVEL